MAPKKLAVKRRFEEDNESLQDENASRHTSKKKKSAPEGRIQNNVSPTEAIDACNKSSAPNTTRTQRRRLNQVSMTGSDNNTVGTSYKSGRSSTAPSILLQDSKRNTRELTETSEYFSGSGSADVQTAEGSLKSPEALPNFENLKKELFDMLQSHEVGEKNKEIILPESVKATWAPRYYHTFYTTQPWYEKSWDRTNDMDNYLRIMSILIYIDFSAWEKFRTIFIDQPERSDKFLPFPLERLQQSDFLERVVGNMFYKCQWAFCPVPIYEREEPYVLQGQELLPWLDESEEIGHGASGTVRKQTLAAKYLIYNNQGINLKPKAVAIKSVSDNNVRKQEFRNLRNLRGCLSGHKRIMVNIATIVEAPVKLSKTYHILYEVAAYDLNVFLTTIPSQHRRKRKESAAPSRNNSENMQPEDLILESRNLADALDFLHNRLYNTKKISLAHNDIKPENILVVYPDSTDAKHKYPVGKWKIADFGLSRVKDKRKAGSAHLCVEDARESPVKTEITHRLEPSVSVSKSFPKRVPGRFTAPELDQDNPLKLDGRGADIWSFGCILSEIIAYAVQLDCKLVEEFRIELSKPDHQDQRFYDFRTKEVKGSFHQFLERLPGQMRGFSGKYNVPWVSECTQLARKIVIKEPHKRLGADKIRDELRDIYRSMRPEKKLWVNDNLNLDMEVVKGSYSPTASSSSETQSPTEIEPAYTRDNESSMSCPGIVISPCRDYFPPDNMRRGTM